MRTLRTAIVAVASLGLGGCFWAAPLGADITVEVRNRTDRAITVVPVGSTFGDDLYNGQRQRIPSGDRARFGYDGLEHDPGVEVRYDGQRRIYDADPSWLGYDTITVETWHFVHGDG
jgi:hypothetical protein